MGDEAQLKGPCAHLKAVGNHPGDSVLHCLLSGRKQGGLTSDFRVIVLLLSTRLLAYLNSGMSQYLNSQSVVMGLAWTQWTFRQLVHLCSPALGRYLKSQVQPVL